MTTLYGIKNCDTIKKARTWLMQHQIDYQFVDYRSDGLSSSQLAEFASQCGWQNLLNTRGTTYRQLAENDKADMCEQKALALMLAQPAMIKRPLLQYQGAFHLGFSSTDYQRIFGLTE